MGLSRIFEQESGVVVPDKAVTLPPDAPDFWSALFNRDIQKLQDYVAQHPEALTWKSKGGLPPLFLACKLVDTKLITALLDMGAEINVPPVHQGFSMIANFFERGGKPALIDLFEQRGYRFQPEDFLHAAKMGCLHGVNRCLAQGIDVNVPCGDHVLSVVEVPGSTALHMAAALNRADVIDVLILHKADLNKQNILGMTPLATAVSLRHFDSTRKLVDAGADLEIADGNGHRPLDILQDDLDVLNNLKEHSTHAMAIYDIIDEMDDLSKMIASKMVEKGIPLKAPGKFGKIKKRISQKFRPNK